MKRFALTVALLAAPAIAQTTQPAAESQTIRLARLQMENDMLRKQVADLKTQLTQKQTANAKESESIHKGMTLDDVAALVKKTPKAYGPKLVSKTPDKETYEVRFTQP